MYKNILLPTDGSDLSSKAMKGGLELARLLRASVVGLHVIPVHYVMPVADVAWYDPKLESDMRNYAQNEGKRMLDKMEADARSQEVAFSRVLFESDQVWKGIIDTATAKRCDLIVMAAHGRRGIAAVVLGSETNRVLIHSTIPVLVYR